MQKKKGISLIVLVITIIVMIILAATIIIAINNNNAVEQAKEAVDKTNLKQVQQLAQTLWADAYIGGAKTQEDLEEAVLDGLKDIDTSKYDVKVTEEGVTVTEKMNFLPIIADALANPDKYKHPEQDSENTAIGIGTDGTTVNMDNWLYSVIEGTNPYIILAEDKGGANYATSYKGEFTESGEIIGTVPVYIKPAGREEFLLVTDMQFTFAGCSALKKSPVLPDSVTNMKMTFIGCSALVEIAKFPTSLLSMESTFQGCSNLTVVGNIPNTVTNMDSTFWACSKLAAAPKIGKSVTNMDSTFWACTSMKTAPVIPYGVENMEGTFLNCTLLEVAPAIPETVVNMKDTFNTCIALTTAPVIPTSVTVMYNTFNTCVALTKAPVIPANVKDMRSTFRQCISLTGDLVINANLETNTDSINYYADCLANVSTKDETAVVLSGTSPQLAEIFATKGTGSHVTMAQ